MVATKSYLAIYSTLAAVSFLMALLWSSILPSTVKPQTFPMTFYQQGIGFLDGRPCSSYPTCSTYSHQALRQYGLLFGSWLTIDRLIHEADDLQYGPRINVNGQTRLHDPLERNAFWLLIR